VHAEYAFLNSPATSQKRLSAEVNLHGRPAAGTLHPSGSPSRAYPGPVFWQAPADWSLSRAYPRLLVCEATTHVDMSTYPLFCHDFRLPQILKTSTKLVVFTTCLCHEIKISTSVPADWSLSRAYPRLLVHRMAVCTGRRLNVMWIYAIHICALMNYGCNICLLMICM